MKGKPKSNPNGKRIVVAGEQGARGDPGEVLDGDPGDPAEGRTQVSQLGSLKVVAEVILRA